MSKKRVWGMVAVLPIGLAGLLAAGAASNATPEVDPNYRTTGLDRKERFDRSNYNRFEQFFLRSQYVTEATQFHSVFQSESSVRVSSRSSDNQRAGSKTQMYSNN